MSQPGGQLRPVRARLGNEQGIAILLTLGIISLLLILALSFASTTTIERKAAQNNTYQIIARLLAESGVQRSTGFIGNELGSEIYPATTSFHRPAGTGDWNGRIVLGSINTDMGPGEQMWRRDGVDTALHVQFNGADFTPAHNNDDPTLDDNIGWNIITSTIDTSSDGQGGSANTKDVIIGRNVFLIEAMQGVDASLIVNKEADTDEGTEIRAGDLLEEINLGDIIAIPNLVTELQPDNLIGPYTPGLMPGDEEWFSFAHIFRASAQAVASAAVVVKDVLPFSRPDNQVNYWSDLDGDNVIDDGEIKDRIDMSDIGSAVTAADLYDAFVGFPDNSTRDDISMFSPWLKSLAGFTSNDAPMLRRIAAQVALNMVDSEDLDDEPALFYVSTSPNQYAFTSGGDPAAFESRLQGTEENFYFGELYAWLKLERIDLGEPINKLKITPEFTVELYNPLEPGALFTGDVVIQYEWQIRAGYPWWVQEQPGAIHTQALVSVTIPNASFDHLVLPSGGTIAHSGNNVWSEPFYIWQETTVFSGGTIDATSVLVDYFRIKDIKVRDSSLDTIDRVPESDIATPSSVVDYPGTPMAVAFLKAGEAPPPGTEASSLRYCYVSLEAKDVHLNGFHQGHPLFSTYMTKDNDVLFGHDPPPWPAAMGAAGPPEWNNQTAPYGHCVVRNYGTGFPDVPVHQEIGRIKGWYPGRSLRLWSSYLDVNLNGEFDSGDVLDDPYHDGFLLDMFTVPTAQSIPGKINLNTRKQTVLEALFSGISDAASVPTVATNILAQNGTTGGNPFHGIGSIAGIVDVMPSAVTTANDKYFKKFGNFITVGQNFYNIIVTAQALRDIGAAATIPGAVQITDNTYAFILAEQKIMATLCHDVFDNSFEVLRLEHVTE